MKADKINIANVVAWANEFIEKNRDLLERMHGYTSEMRRADELADQLRNTRKNRSRIASGFLHKKEL